jgi:hypothetical protein
MTQMALSLRRLAVERGAGLAHALSLPVVPLILIAETCSWYAVLTTNYVGNACEESLWTLSAGLLLAGCAALWPKCGARLRRRLLVPFVAAPCYLAFMCRVDVPMYLSRWRADQSAGRTYLTLSRGLYDVSHRWTVTRQWADWRTEIPWMTLYFSFAVWISIALAIPSSHRISDKIT